MALFGRKKDKNGQGEELESSYTKASKGEDKKSAKKGKKGKEAKKPWGKKERILVIAVILLTVGISVSLALSSRAWKLPGFPRLALQKPSFPFLGEETIVLEGRRQDQEKANRAVEAFTTQTRNLSGLWGLYVVRLNNGYSYGANEGEVFQAASLIKLPVMVGMYLEVEEGNLNLDQSYTLKNSDKVSGAGSLYARPAGYEITYRNLVRLMGKESDNTAFNIARNYLGDEKVSEVINSLGMVDTSLEENETTPSDIGSFFQDLWNGNILNEEHKEELLEYLTDTAYEAWLAEGVPDEIRVAHKYGRELHVINDAGIVYADEPFVIVVLSKGVEDSDADNAFPSLVNAIFDIETSE